MKEHGCSPSVPTLHVCVCTHHSASVVARHIACGVDDLGVQVLWNAHSVDNADGAEGKKTDTEPHVVRELKETADSR